MKKKFLILGICMMLVGCSSSAPQKKDPPISSAANIEESKKNDFVLSSSDIIKALPNEELLDMELANVLYEINVSEISSISYENYSTNSYNDSIYVNVILETDLQFLRCNCFYMLMPDPDNGEYFDYWNIVSIEGYDNKHCYYNGSYDGIVDLYDYQTDTLVSEKYRNFDDIDPVEELNRSIDSYKVESDKEWDSLEQELNRLMYDVDD